MSFNSNNNDDKKKNNSNENNDDDGADDVVVVVVIRRGKNDDSIFTEFVLGNGTIKCIVLVDVCLEEISYRFTFEKQIRLTG